MTTPPLYILRHGETVWNAEKRMQGRLDSPLSAKGRRQAITQNSILRACNLTGFVAFSSPRSRAFHTASLALDGLLPRIETDARLGEIGVGVWEGLLRSEIPSIHPADGTEEGTLAFYERAPSGEGFAALKSRCSGFLSELSSPAVLVTHGITSRMLRLILLGLEMSEIGSLPGGQGVVFHVGNGVQTKLTLGA